MRRTWRTLIRSRRAASAWVRSPLRTLCMTLRTSRSFWLIGIRSGVGTSIAMAPPWPEQGGHFYRVKTGHFYCRSTGGMAEAEALRRHGWPDPLPWRTAEQERGVDRQRLALGVMRRWTAIE